MIANKKMRNVSLGLALSFLTGCGSGGGDSSSQTEKDVCSSASEDINIEALLTKDCASLADYNLFKKPTNPTADPNGRGIPYELSTALFTDYASKYRFVFIPEGKTAQYVENESLDFPIGSVITKTFSLPQDTAHRGFNNEKLIETRLLIKRDSGWTALPYVWNDEQTEATLKEFGPTLANKQITHNGVTHTFNYLVPSTSQCKSCHQLGEQDPNEEGNLLNSRFEPIGPKARLLNFEIDYTTGSQNQLIYWQENKLLEGVPANLSSIDSIPVFHDDLQLDYENLKQNQPDQLQKLAKGYLDINCAHCHRPEGGAGYTGLVLEYWRNYAGNEGKHGRCKGPVASSHPTMTYDLIPGNKDTSFLYYRINITPEDDAKRMMPELGRTLIHEEGAELVGAWIDSLEPDPCE